MAAPTSMSDIINKTSAGDVMVVMIYANITETTWTDGATYDLYMDYSNAGSGVTPPTSATACGADDGGVAIDPPGVDKRWYVTLAEVVDTGGAATERYGTIVVYDRLLHISGLDGTVTTAQTVGGTIGRNTAGDGNQILFTTYTALGATPTTATCSYTNQAGTSGRTTQPLRVGGAANSEDNDVYAVEPFLLQAGDTGVRSVQSVTLAGSTGTAGNFGITLVRPILVAAAGAGTHGVPSGVHGHREMPYIEDDACVSVYYDVQTTGESPLLMALTAVAS